MATRAGIRGRTAHGYRSPDPDAPTPPREVIRAASRALLWPFLVITASCAPVVDTGWRECGNGDDAECDDDFDGDEDGDGYKPGEGDCDDTDPKINPGATELCDGIDNNCEGTIDEGEWFPDVDGDGYGYGAASTAPDCAAGELAADDGRDCDDLDPAINPRASEVCNGIDDDCDGEIDDGATTHWYADSDGDGYGEFMVRIDACEAPGGFVADATDCDDTNPSINPSFPEVCDGVDNNCDGTIDESACALR